ncbi:deoxyribonuclease V [Psychromonas sp. PT13]|uniref:deoxyribonuclease V n=1 Tax=Psychromonas sp. PT13 TaxID=3439547 RepID=UPI003EB82DEC
MQPIITHPWKITEKQALQLQEKLASKVIKKDKHNEIKLIAGVDVAYAKETNKIIAAIIILDAITFDIVETSIAEDIEQFPYIPGLFSFRELPSLIKAFAKLKNIPDLVVCDGQGYAHPRRFGLACHLGVIFDIPTIGCGKNRLLGTHDNVDTERGSIAPLIDNNEVIGNVLRTQNNIKPIYVSIGHKVSLETATRWILKLANHYRLPETTRKSDQAVKKAMSDFQLNQEHETINLSVELLNKSSH